VEIAIIKTSGDKFLDRPLADIGGKGLFTQEIEEALSEEHIHMAVHSMKDVPTVLPGGLVISCILPREDPRDAFISNRAASIEELPQGAVVGTASLRRAAQLRSLRPDLVVETLRGNVQTRLRKLEEGVTAATLLALAGLKRLGLEDCATAVLETDLMLPAVAQGAIGIECREDNTAIRELLAPLNHSQSEVCIVAERALLAALDGSCRTPIAALAKYEGGEGLSLRGLVARPDGSRLHRVSHSLSHCDGVAGARELGRDVGEELLREAGPGFFDSGSFEGD
jgi:hydroxymethylbilane synthase